MVGKRREGRKVIIKSNSIKMNLIWSKIHRSLLVWQLIRSINWLMVLRKWCHLGVLVARFRTEVEVVVAVPPLASKSTSCSWGLRRGSCRSTMESLRKIWNSIGDNWVLSSCSKNKWIVLWKDIEFSNIWVLNQKLG